jgi:hypothetical protein
MVRTDDARAAFAVFQVALEVCRAADKGTTLPKPPW